MKTSSRFSPDVSAGLGFLLLAVPTYFVAMSALRYDAPGLRFLDSPFVVLGSLAAAFTVNALSVLSVKFEQEMPPVLRVSLSFRLWNLAGIVLALVLLGALLAYAFFENFAPRAIK